MNEPPERPPVRRYGDSEVASILKRATELQRAEPSAADPEGLTLAELAEIAREAGIDPDLLRRAAAEIESRTPESTLVEKLAGAPMKISVERTVPGELAPDRFDGIIPLIQVATDGQGTASAVGKTLTWSSRTDTNSAGQQVLVASRDGETLIRVEETYTGLASAMFGGIVGGVGVGAGVGAGGALAGILGSAVLGITLPLAVLGGSYAGARAIYSRTVRRREAAAVRLVDEIAAYATGETARELGPASSPS
ncbi:MAG: hypothetical protein OEM23_02535 [Gemmatimonadota bacterium]|nr:hypothetical protein [Gemmatimonadota bacterium]MDH3427288.1 hypothetical protein [Gemmatimonadota bacterium]